MAILQAASGYGSLAATPLARPGYHNEIIMRVEERDFLPEITNNTINERILRCNQVIQFLKQPEVGQWRPYSQNQEMIPNQITAEGMCLTICNAAYNSIKIDETDIFWACDRWDTWEKAFLEAIYQRYVEMMRTWVLTMMVLETSPNNKGAKAGVHRNINLGAPGAPVVITAENLILHLARLQQILKDTQRWKEGEMFIIMPTAFTGTLAMSNYANNSWTGDCAPCTFGIDGMWSKPLMGFKVIETTYAPYAVEADGSIGYYIIAGWSQAFLFASDIIQGRLINMQNTFGILYQMLAVWGGKMIYPEAMAVAYWSFQV